MKFTDVTIVLRRNVVVESVEGKTIPKKQKPGITFKKKERAARVKTWREMKANAKQTHLFLYKQ